MKTFLIWFFTAECSLQTQVGTVKGPPVFLLLCFIALIYSLMWVARDAEKRGKSIVLAILFVLIFCWPFSLLAWRWLRPPICVPPAVPKAPAP